MPPTFLTVVGYGLLALILVPLIIFVCIYVPIISLPVLLAAAIRIALENYATKDSLVAIQATLQDSFKQAHIVIPLALILMSAIHKAYRRQHRQAAYISLWLGFVTATALRMLAWMTDNLFPSPESKEPKEHQSNGEQLGWGWMLLLCVCGELRKKCEDHKGTFTWMENSSIPGRKYECTVDMSRKVVDDEACVVVWFELIMSIARCFWMRFVFNGRPNKSDLLTTEEALMLLLVAAFTVWQVSRSRDALCRRPSDVEECRERTLLPYYDVESVAVVEDDVKLEFWSDSLQRLQSKSRHMH